MSAVADLSKQLTSEFLSVVARYWMLASRPAEFFEKYVKDKTAEDLRQLIRHFLVAVTA